MVKDVFIGIVTDHDYDEDKALNVMKDMHREFNVLFKNKLKYIGQAKELKPNKFDNKFKA